MGASFEIFRIVSVHFFMCVRLFVGRQAVFCYGTRVLYMQQLIQRVFCTGNEISFFAYSI